MNLQSTEEIIKKNRSESIAEKWNEQSPNDLYLEEKKKERNNINERVFGGYLEWKRTRNWVLWKHSRDYDNLGVI